MRGRIVITGAESTGKTTLADTLARTLDHPLLPEQLRIWVDRAGRLPNKTDMAAVALQHIAADEQIIGLPGDLAILDTDLATIAIYWGHYFGEPPSWLIREVKARTPLLYLIADADIPWESDPQRDGPETRLLLQDRFISWIPTLAPAIIVRGSMDERLEQAVSAVNSVASRKTRCK